MAQFLAFAGGVGFAALGTVLAHNAVWDRVTRATTAINAIEHDVPGLPGLKQVPLWPNWLRLDCSCV